MTIIQITEDRLREILTIMYAYGLIDLKRSLVDMPYVAERVKMYLEAKALVDDMIKQVQ